MTSGAASENSTGNATPIDRGDGCDGYLWPVRGTVLPLCISCARLLLHDSDPTPRIKPAASRDARGTYTCPNHVPISLAAALAPRTQGSKT